MARQQEETTPGCEGEVGTPRCGGRRPWSIGRVALLAVHWAIILNLAAEMAYAGYVVFFVVAPDGGGPLFSQAATFPFEMMVTRRLYAIEFWIACGALSIYLGITEVAPRFWRSRVSASSN